MSESKRPSPTGVPLAKRTPTVADYRRQTTVRDRWHNAAAVLFVTGLAAFVFWLLPLPPAATGSPVAASNRSSA